MEELVKMIEDRIDEEVLISLFTDTLTMNYKGTLQVVDDIREHLYLDIDGREYCLSKKHMRLEEYPEVGELEILFGENGEAILTF